MQCGHEKTIPVIGAWYFSTRQIQQRGKERYDYLLHMCDIYKSTEYVPIFYINS